MMKASIPHTKINEVLSILLQTEMIRVEINSKKGKSGTNNNRKGVIAAYYSITDKGIKLLEKANEIEEMLTLK